MNCRSLEVKSSNGSSWFILLIYEDGSFRKLRYISKSTEWKLNKKGQMEERSYD